MAMPASRIVGGVFLFGGKYTYQNIQNNIFLEKVTHIRCKECDFSRLAPKFYKNWARHCNDHHKGGDGDARDKRDDAEDKNDDGDDDEHDGADQPDDVQPEDAAEPRKHYGPKRSEPRTAAPVRRQRDSAGDQVTQKAKKPKGEATCKKKSKLE